MLNSVVIADTEEEEEDEGQVQGEGKSLQQNQELISAIAQGFWMQDDNFTTDSLSLSPALVPVAYVTGFGFLCDIFKGLTCN